MAQPDESPTATLSDYFQTIWIRKWLVLGITIAVAAAAYLYSASQTTLYDASARLMYVSPTTISNSVVGSSIDPNTMTLELQSVSNTIGSPAVRQRAASALSPQDRALSYSVGATIVSPANTTSGSAIADTVVVRVETTNAAAAARIANAYSDAVIALRKESEQAGYKAAETVVQNQLNLFKTAQSRLTSDYANLVQMLHNLQIGEASATGNFQVIVPASTPGEPVSPHPSRKGILGLGIGLVVGVGVAFVMSQFDTRVRTHRKVAEILGMPVVGRLPRMERQARDNGSNLLAMSEPDGNTSEALRVVRSNLDWASIDEPIRTLLLTSSLENEGKTVTLCNLAVALARSGKKVVVIDADLRNPSVHQVFNLPNLTGLTSVILGHTPFDRAAQRFPSSRAAHATGGPSSKAAGNGQWEGSLLVLTSGPRPPNPGEVVASQRFASGLREVAESGADYVLIDVPPILGVGDVGAMAASVDGLLMIVDMERARKTTLVDAREILERLPCRKIGIVTVRERLDEAHYRYADA